MFGRIGMLGPDDSRCIWKVQDTYRNRGHEAFGGERGIYPEQIARVKVPLSELFGFTTQLRSATEGRGVPNLEFSHYAVVPRNVQDDIIASRK